MLRVVEKYSKWGSKGTESIEIEVENKENKVKLEIINIEQDQWNVNGEYNNWLLKVKQHELHLLSHHQIKKYRLWRYSHEVTTCFFIKSY